MAFQASIKKDEGWEEQLKKTGVVLLVFEMMKMMTPVTTVFHG